MNLVDGLLSQLLDLMSLSDLRGALKVFLMDQAGLLLGLHVLLEVAC